MNENGYGGRGRPLICGLACMYSGQQSKITNDATVNLDSSSLVNDY